MGNSLGFPEARSPYPVARRLSDKNTPRNDNFELRWHCFVESLDVTDDKMKLLEQLPYPRKLELVLNYELNTVKFLPTHCVESIKMARISQITASKRKQDHDDFRKIFTSVEISLRTNKIEWVLEFLENHGLEAIVTFMGDSLKYLSKTDAFRSANWHANVTRRKSSIPTEEFVPSSLARRDPSSPTKSKNLRGPYDKPPPSTPSFSLSRNKSVSPTWKGQNMPLSTSLSLETLKDCLHLCLKCFKTLLTNQNGCTKAFENPELIEMIPFCTLHPNYATKALALDLLSAICLLGGGHARVLKAFDHFRRTLGENACFETIINDFQVHEDLPLDQYNIEYSVACIQFINIVVHSPENINLRVYLQYTFTLHGLDDFLRALQARPGDKLNRHVEAYVNNMVNCSLLLDDAEAKEAAIEEVSRLEAALEASECTAKHQAASFKQRDIALSELVESLRGKIRDINVAAGQQEAASKRIRELEQSLDAAHRQIQRLQNAFVATAATAIAVETSSLDQVRPISSPRKKKSSRCNMTTSTTLPMGVEFAVADAGSKQRGVIVADRVGLNGSPPSAESRRKSMSLEILSTVSQSTPGVDNDALTAVASTSPTSPLSSASASSCHSSSEVNYGTFSRKSGSIGEKSRRGFISSTVISQVSDLTLARRTFKDVFMNLSGLVSQLASTSCPTPPCPSPALPLPSWHTLSSCAVDDAVMASVAPVQRLRRVIGCGNGTASFSSQLCHRLVAVLPDPWDICFASAHRVFQLGSHTDKAVEENEELRQGKEEEENREGNAKGKVEQTVGADSEAVRLLKWLVSSRLITADAMSLENPSTPTPAPAATARTEMEIDQRKTAEVAAVLPLVTALLSVSLNPFVATRLLSLLEAATVAMADGSECGDGGWWWWCKLGPLARLFDAVEAHLRVRLGGRDLCDSPIYQSNASPDWPLLQALLKVNLLPFALTANLQLLVEQLLTLSTCCNSIVTSTGLLSVLRITEGLVSTFLGKPDFVALEISDLFSLADWHLPMRGKSVDVLEAIADGFEGGSTHCRKPFMKALHKAVKIAAPEALGWTRDVVHLDAVSRLLPSDMRSCLDELEYCLSLRDALFPAPEIPGHLQYLAPDIWTTVAQVKTALTGVETVIGAAAYCIHLAMGCVQAPTFSDREFASEMASLARFYSSFKKLTSDVKKRAGNTARASSLKASRSTSVHRRNCVIATASDNCKRHHHSGESAPLSSHNGYDTRNVDRRRRNSRHSNTVGIMDNILAGLDSEPLYADIHKAQVKKQPIVGTASFTTTTSSSASS